jgi:hypothetical protein
MNSIQLRDKVALSMLEALLKHHKSPTRKPEEYLAKLIEREYRTIIK